MFHFKIHWLLNTYNSVSANWSITKIIHTCLFGYPGKNNMKHSWSCGWFFTSEGQTSVFTAMGIAALLQVWWVLVFHPWLLGPRVTKDFPSWLLIQMKSRWYHSESALSGGFSVAGRAKKHLRLGGVNLISCKTEELAPLSLHQTRAGHLSHRRRFQIHPILV